MALFAMLRKPENASRRATLRESRLAATQKRVLSGDTDATLEVGKGLAIVGVIIGAVVSVSIVAALFPTFMDSLSGINAKLNDNNTTTGDSTADSLLPVFSILVGLGGLFGIIGIIIAAVHFGKKA